MTILAAGSGQENPLVEVPYPPAVTLTKERDGDLPAEQKLRRVGPPIFSLLVALPVAFLRQRLAELSV